MAEEIVRHLGGGRGEQLPEERDGFGIAVVHCGGQEPHLVFRGQEDDTGVADQLGGQAGDEIEHGLEVLGGLGQGLRHLGQ